MRDPSDPAERASTGFACALLIVVGSLATALAMLGAFLPVLPTTPFLILAAACFARSSPAFHRRLLENRVFGRYLRQWEHDHTVPRDAKRKAYGLVVVSFGISIWLVDSAPVRITLACIATALIVFLAWLRTTPPTPEDDPDEGDDPEARGTT